MRRRIFEIIEPGDNRNRNSTVYDLVMMLTIVISIIPLAFKQTIPVFQWID